MLNHLQRHHFPTRPLISLATIGKTIALSFTFFVYILLSGQSQAQIYKYQKPSGKLLFTDSEVMIPGYILLNRHEIYIPANSNNKTKGHFNSKKFDREITQASQRHGIQGSLIKAIIKAESSFNPDAISKAGAEGLMQLMPKTAASYNVNNSFNIKQNISGGTQHIKYLLGKYKNNLTLALAAYNAGETAVNKHNGIPPYPETQGYVKKVLSFKKQFDNK